MEKQLKTLKIKTQTITICYGRNGHRLYKGPTNDIPKHLLEYYVGLIIKNKKLDNTYVEVTEDKEFWR